MDHLHNGCVNLFNLSKMNCINSLIIFIEFSIGEATSCVIIIAEYNLMCFTHVLVFDVNGDEQILLFKKKTDKNDDESLMEFKKTKKLQKVVGQYGSCNET